MSIFKKKCLFSEVSGVISSQGNPVEGAEVERYYKWQGPDKSGKETVKTDSAGRFKFSAVYDNAVLASLFPHNPSIQQEIHIRFQGKEYEAYMLMKGNYEANGELDGKLLNLSCNLEDEPSRDGGFYGICPLFNEPR
jgi:hypothetical protein